MSRSKFPLHSRTQTCFLQRQSITDLSTSHYSQWIFYSDQSASENPQKISGLLEKTRCVCLSFTALKTSSNSWAFPGFWHDRAGTSPIQIPVTFAVADLPSPASELLISSKMPEVMVTWLPTWMGTFMLLFCSSGLCSKIWLVFVIQKLCQWQWPSSSEPLPVLISCCCLGEPWNKNFIK